MLFAAPSSREMSPADPGVLIDPHRLCLHGDQPQLEKLPLVGESVKRKAPILVRRPIAAPEDFTIFTKINATQLKGSEKL